MTDTVAHARRGDIDTSHHAAASVTNVVSKRQAVFTVLQRVQASPPPNHPEYADGLTHTSLIEAYRFASDMYPDRFPPQTEQSIRSRCAELVREGSVADTGQRVLLDGSQRRSAVWAVVQP